MRAFTALCLSLVLTACVSTPTIPQAPENITTPDFQPPPPGARITILPMQETQYDMLRNGAEVLENQIKKELTALGYKVTQIKRDDYLKMWQEEAKVVGGVYEGNGDFKAKAYLQALDALVKKTCLATECSLLINHQLIMRPALIQEGYIAWDGRRLPLLVKPDTEQGYGISVEITAVAPSGDLAFKRYGAVIALSGLSVEEMRQHIQQQNLFNTTDIALGCSIALQPLRDKAAKTPPSTQATTQPMTQPTAPASKP